MNADTIQAVVEQKQSRLCLSADLTHAQSILALADELGPELAMLKTHIDIVEDFSWTFIEQLKALSKKHHFLLFEDRKFADIGTTVQLQCAKGVYRIADWADLINAHALPGPGIISGLRQACEGRDVGLLLLAQMSSAGSLFDEDYVKQTVAMAEENADFVCGFIAQSRVCKNPAMMHLTPGVQLEAKSGELGQQYRTPQRAIETGSDIVIVGRGIYGSDDPLATAKAYRKASYLD